MKNDVDKIFDMEQSIMSCWNIIEDLKLLNENVSQNENFTKEDISNYLLGLETIYQMKFDKCFNNFEGICEQYYAYRKVHQSSQDDML